MCVFVCVIYAREGFLVSTSFTMEQSSPLAAMQPSPVIFGNCFRSEATASYPGFPSVKKKFGPESFNFKDLSMRKPQPDYFSSKQVRGSSPAASLAADLSQNFHIDYRLVLFFNPWKVLEPKGRQLTFSSLSAAPRS